jgi:hypothetical protein
VCVGFLFFTYISMTVPLSNPYALRAIYTAPTALFHSAQAARPATHAPQGVHDSQLLFSARARDCANLGRRQSSNLADSLTASMILLPRLSAILRIAVLVPAIVLPAGLVGHARAENSEIGVRRSTERTFFTDAEMTEGFFKIAFRAEM